VGPSFYQDGRLTQFGGSVSSPVHYQTGAAGDVAVGWAFNRYVSMDFQTGFTGTRIDNVPGYTQNNSDVYDVPFLGNVLLSYPIPHTILVPYVGVGAGGADTIFDAHSFSDGTTTVFGRENDAVFAWQVMAGMRFELNPDMTVGVGYQYFTTGNTTYSYPPSPNFNVGFDGVRTHSVLFTFEWKFW
jgi:opacity protein-like surface antigen